MAKLARLPANDRVPDSAAAGTRRVPRSKIRYFAFLSYSHKDEEVAAWLHRELEEFRVPATLAGKLTGNGVTPKRLTPIFRDEQELAAANDLGEEIEEALAASQYLVVLCSPDAARSRWTNAEIDAFKRTRPDGCVLAAIVSGEPFASDIPGRESEECFPPALRQKYDRRGRPTGKRAEPLAADLREVGDGRRLGFLKLVAGMLGVGLDDLVQRETTQRHRRLAWVAAASLAGMAVTSTLAVMALGARDEARDQRREAEGLVAFMLGDLKDKLEPIGRLDALDGVGSRVLAYYREQDASELSDAALLQRARALSLTAQVSYLRGDLDGALRLYREALAGTGEAIRREPSDPQRLFDHAQNVFWIGDIARQRGDRAAAERSAREYKQLAQRMVAIDPDNMKWRVEQQNANTELGVVLLEQRRFSEAAAQFGQAMRTIEALATANPTNFDYQKSRVDTLAWLADAEAWAGKLDRAIALRRRQIALLSQLLEQSRGDVAYRLKLIPAHRALGNLLAARGDFDAAMEQLRKATAVADDLLPAEPNNRLWTEFAANAHLNAADQLVGAGRVDEAAVEAGRGCGLVGRLMSADPKVMQWRAAQRNCLVIQARVALSSGAKGQALRLTQRAVEAARSISTNDAAGDRHALAKAFRLLGDARQANGDTPGARAAWNAAAAAVPTGVAHRPNEMSEHQIILQRVGRDVEAARVAAALNSIGYRNITA